MHAAAKYALLGDHLLSFDCSSDCTESPLNTSEDVEVGLQPSLFPPVGVGLQVRQITVHTEETPEGKKAKVLIEYRFPAVVNTFTDGLPDSWPQPNLHAPRPVEKYWSGYVDLLKVRMATTYIPFMRPVDGVRWTPSVGQDWKHSQDRYET